MPRAGNPACCPGGRAAPDTDGAGHVPSVASPSGKMTTMVNNQGQAVPVSPETLTSLRELRALWKLAQDVKSGAVPAWKVIRTVTERKRKRSN